MELKIIPKVIYSVTYAETENIQEKKSANLAKKSLIDFYREIPEGQGGTDLGLYYLSYLDEACKKVNVKF